MPLQAPTPESHTPHTTAVPFAEHRSVPSRPLHRLVGLFPGRQFLRYLLVGGFNTLFGYGTFVTLLALLNSVVPQRFLPLTVIAASLLSSPINITVAFLGYKFFVFKTEGNYLREWLKCFAVYGTGMIPGLVALGALTRLFQAQLHRHTVPLHHALAAVEAHLAGKPLSLLQHVVGSKSLAGNLAGAIVIALSTVYSFVGHKKVTFRATPPVASEALPFG